MRADREQRSMARRGASSRVGCRGKQNRDRPWEEGDSTAMDAQDFAANRKTGCAPGAEDRARRGLTTDSTGAGAS
jgi:hypothetical protein